MTTDTEGDPQLAADGQASAPVSVPTFPIAGIGASAGGLEALELLLAGVRPDSGIAFVVVQHQDPTHASLLSELLQRATAMAVVEVADRTAVEPNRVYVMPPDTDMSILHGVLHLLPSVTARGLRLPIDFFLRSLASDQRERAIGVILSGMGSDGTLGLRAIKEAGGAAFVQDPATAKFDSMPRSAIGSGMADVVAGVEEIPARIEAYLRHVPPAGPPEALLSEQSRSDLEKVMILLRAQTGHDFTQYKPSTVCRRIQRRMGLHQLDRMDHYVRYLRENPQETDLLFKELLIGVTSFFRDPAVWDQLRDEVLAPLVEGRALGAPLRAWVAGCATGEEAYSLAITFRETLDRVQPAAGGALQVFATDLDADAIARAREAIYPANIAADVSPERLDRFFVPVERGYQVARTVREMVVFAPQNLIMDPPFTKLDLLCCRNLLIYLLPELQQRLLPLFHYTLNPGGTLLLGSAETVGGFTQLFERRSGPARLYRRLDPAAGPVPVEFPSHLVATPPREAKPVSRPAASLQAVAEHMLLTHFAPAAVLTTEQGDILFVNGRTGRYLEPAAGKANWNLFAMAREGLNHALNTAFQKAVRDKTVVHCGGVSVETDAGTQAVDVTVQFLTEPAALQGMVVVVFQEGTAPVATASSAKSRRGPSTSARVAELELSLRQLRDELQANREQMQASQEELRSANEELQSTNEELQSTNEELTTSKEEMQSMNEELQTVNHELQAKVDELTQASSDMRNLLDNTDLAILFLDASLRVRRFTPQAAKLIKLIPADAGRPITDITGILDYAQLAEDADSALRRLAPVERQVPTSDARWFAARIMPYRTLDNRIDGVVVTFADITREKTLETRLEGDSDGT